MDKNICEFCETRENGFQYCIGHKTIITCCGYPSLKKEECLVYQLKTENSELKGKNAKLQYEAEKWRNAFYVKEDALQEAENETEAAETKMHKYKHALEQIRQVVEFAIEEVLTVSQKNGTAKILEIISEVLQ